LVGDGARSFVGDEERDRWLGMGAVSLVGMGGTIAFWGVFGERPYRVLGRFWGEARSFGGDGEARSFLGSFWREARSFLGSFWVEAVSRFGSFWVEAVSCVEIYMIFLRHAARTAPAVAAPAAIALSPPKKPALIA